MNCHVGSTVKARSTRWKHFFVLLLMISSITLLTGSNDAYAINANDSTLPQGFKDVIYGSRRNPPRGLSPYWGQTKNGSGNYQCGYGGEPNPPYGLFNHMNPTWLSLANQSTVVEATIPDKTDSVNLWFNAGLGHCDSIIGSDLKVNQKDLQATQTNIKKVVVTGISGASAAGLEGKAVKVNVNPTYTNNNRFAFSHVAFTLEGLGSLPAGTYNVILRVTYVPVNGYINNNTCVVDGRPASRLDSPCPPTTANFPIKLTVKPRYDARCEVKNIRTPTRTTITSTGGNPTGNIAYLAPKQEFTATFAVRNAGTEAWKLVRSNPDVAENLYRLGPVPDDNTWGQRRLTILGPSNEFGGAALSGGSLSRDFTATFKVPDNLAAGSSRVFTWRVIHDGAGKPNQGWFGSICSATISIRDNRPYLRVSGSDMKAGATFKGKGFEGDDTYKNAPIDTNGRGDGAGSSSGQYAVFASGLINKEASSANNIFGNNLHTLPGNIKDLLFANTGNEGNYGTFYGEGGPPDINISELVNEAGKTPLNNGFGTRVASEGSAHFDGDQELGITSVRGSKVIVVDGDLTINGDVTYNGVGPNLIFVVRGNIFVKADVTKLDGTYIAFPTNKDDGIFDTCSNVAGVAAGVWPDSNQALSVNTCNKQLTITGRLIAKKVLWKRTWGTIGASGAVISGQCAAGDANNSNRISELERCAAEFINFSPEAYFNSPLDSTPTGSVGNVPISTIELPPIY